MRRRLQDVIDQRVDDRSMTSEASRSKTPSTCTRWCRHAERPMRTDSASPRVDDGVATRPLDDAQFINGLDARVDPHAAVAGTG